MKAIQLLFYGHRDLRHIRTSPAGIYWVLPRKARRSAPMATCSCGAPLDRTGTLCRRCAALAVLGVPSNATFREIKRAYQLLVKVWHPDRFQSDKAVLGAVDARMKEVNSAFAFLKEHPDPVRPQNPEPDPHTSSVHETYAQASAPVRPVRSSSAFLRTFLGLVPPRRTLLRLAGLLIALLLTRYIWIALDLGAAADPGVARMIQSGKDTLLSGLERPKERFLEAVKSDAARLNPFRSRSSHAEESRNLANDLPTSQPAPKPAVTVRRDRNPAQARVQRVTPLITVGSTRSEVIELLGPPTSGSADQLAYGESILYLHADSVVGWKIDPVSAPMRVKMWPTRAVDPTLKEFGLGSSKDQVLAVQGTPTAFSGDRFEYGRSVVFFKEGRVIGWKDDPTSTVLRVGAR